jgi:hypothetical protein
MESKLSDLIGELDYHEAMDRTYMIADIVDQHLIQHQVFKVEKEYAEKIEAAGMLLAEAYQIIANIRFNKFNENDNRTKGE